MGPWLSHARDATRLVADRPQLWLTGGLAWAATMGPVALLAAVVPAPEVSDLTFLGARLYGSATWPWNAIAIAALSLAVPLAALALVALADLAALGAVGFATLRRGWAVTLVSALPAVLAAAALLIGVAVVAPDEFGAPDRASGGPLLRTALRLGPLLALLLACGAIGGALATAARLRLAVGRDGVVRALAGAARALAASGISGVAQLVAGVAARLAYLLFATLLLAVLWAPIGAELSGGAGFGAAQASLLVGFVAIWLCLVLGGGAVHSWALVCWTRILAFPRSRPADTTETASTS